MKLLFACFSPFAMDVTTPDREPLGGSESCVAYLARQLAANGHDVTFAGRLPPATPRRLMGVRHVPVETLANDIGYDAVITLSAPVMAEEMKRIAPRALHIAWLHMMPGQSSMAPLAAMARQIDCAVFVSNYHRAITPYRGNFVVIGNGIAPAFENMFASAEDLRAAKQDRAAYTSMPYRGLHHLVEVIGRMKGETRFDIFSAMQTCRESDDDFMDLYARLKSAPRTAYHGALAKPALAQAMKNAAFLSYPSTFVETYCIAALEAIAAGLKVVSTELGALPETTLGFADLMPITAETSDADIARRYTERLEKNVALFHADPAKWSQERFDQSQAVNRLCSWRARAGEWEKLLAFGLARLQGR